MKLLLNIICIGLLTQSIYADSVNQLLKKARGYQESNPDSCIYLSQKALTQISDHQVEERAVIYWNLSQGYLYKHQYHTALFYGLRGQELFTDQDTARIYQDILATMGWIYFDIRNMQQAEPFHRRALQIAQQRKDIRSEVVYTNAIGLDVMNGRQYKKALGYFRKALFLLDQSNKPYLDLRSTVENNIGVVYLKQENWSKAEEYLLKSINNSSGKATPLVETYSYLAKVYLQTHQLHRCENILMKADELSYETTYSFSLIEYYQVRYEYEKLTGNLQAAYLYQNKYIELYKKINNKEVQNVMNYLLDMQADKIEQDKLLLDQANEIKDNKIQLAVIGVVFMLLIIATFYYIFKSKAEKATLRQLLLSRELEEKDRQHAELNDELAFKREAIETLALTLSKHNELFKILAVSVRESESKELKEAWGKLERALNQDSKTTILPEEYVEDFRYRLKSKYPGLTEKDIQLIIDIRNNLTSKEMADKHHIEVKSIEMSRYRLRKKLEIDKGIQLREYIMKL